VTAACFFCLSPGKCREKKGWEEQTSPPLLDPQAQVMGLENTILDIVLKMNRRSQTWWYMPIIPALMRLKTGGSQDRGQLGLSRNKTKQNEQDRVFAANFTLTVKVTGKKEPDWCEGTREVTLS
jgi:hypothetical protein